MNVQGKPYVTIWAERAAEGSIPVHMIDQRALPHEFRIVTMRTHRDTAAAIRDMTIRGAPAIGAAGGYGLAQAIAEAPTGPDRGAYIAAAHQLLRSTRPTAYDLFYFLDRVHGSIDGVGPADQPERALAEANRLAAESIHRCRRIGEEGARLLERGATVLTHCNAGWLATVDWGTALSPVYHAHRAGRSPRVLADETRPRMQGANLTSWELAQEGIDCELIADNAAGLLMRRGEVQLVITGADRIAANGDAANKIGTYEKALLARANNIPFYIAAPASTFDLNCPSGDAIPIEERSADELLYTSGRTDSGEIVRVRTAPEGIRARNPAFDVTPAELITGLITEHGIIQPDRESIKAAIAAKG
jgi:methylthioribose-1-phosphate isomerase